MLKLTKQKPWIVSKVAVAHVRDNATDTAEVIVGTNAKLIAKTVVTVLVFADAVVPVKVAVAMDLVKVTVKAIVWGLAKRHAKEVAKSHAVVVALILARVVQYKYR